jgi:hypothetical protein
VNSSRLILEELRVSRRVITSGNQVTPRLTVQSPSGTFVVMTPLPRDHPTRVRIFNYARLFMVWKAATSFVLSAELGAPDAVTSVFVSRYEVYGAVQAISRDPLTFADLRWTMREEVAEDILALLPPKILQIGDDDARILKKFEDGTVSELAWMKPDDELK